MVIRCSFLDVRERQSTIGIGDVDDLIEPRNRVTHMFCVGQWFFTLLRKRVAPSCRSLCLVSPPCFREISKSFRHVFVILS